MNTIKYVCETNVGFHEKDVQYSPSLSPEEAIASSEGHVHFWMAQFVREGEEFKRWWVENPAGDIIRGPSSELSVYVDKHGKLKAKR